MPAGFLTRGQPAAVARVAAWISGERSPASILVVGPARVGKTTLALDLAAGLLCLAADPAARPCRDCAACRKAEHGNHPDLHRLAPSGPGGQVRIDQVRGLLSELALLPMEGRCRVAVVEAAHRLNPDAQNALLKTLEEPPPAAVIILCADDETLLLDTLRSRCTRLRLGPVDARVCADLLVERGLADAARAARLSRAAGGRPGVAIALAGAPDALIVRGRLARTLLDLAEAPRHQRLAAAPALLGDAVALADAADGSVERPAPAEGPVPGQEDDPGEAPARTVSPADRRRAAIALIAAWRDVARDLAVVAAGGRAEIRDPELLEDFERAAAGLDRAAVVAFLGRLDGLGAAVESYANPELVVDVLLLAWPRSRRAA
jgi:DNA polymerase III delta' subunit